MLSTVRVNYYSLQNGRGLTFQSIIRQLHGSLENNMIRFGLFHWYWKIGYSAEAEASEPWSREVFVATEHLTLSSRSWHSLAKQQEGLGKRLTKKHQSAMSLLCTGDCWWTLTWCIIFLYYECTLKVQFILLSETSQEATLKQFCQVLYPNNFLPPNHVDPYFCLIQHSSLVLFLHIIKVLQEIIWLLFMTLFFHLQL